MFNGETKETNFGFLEITRGNLTFGSLGFQQTPGEGATAQSISAVPVPAPLALLAFALLGLFGLRSRTA